MAVPPATTRILLRSGKSPFDSVSPEQMMQRDAILSNSGNLLFQNSVFKMLSAENTEIVSNRGKVDPKAAQRINDEFDVFAVPLANAFRPTFLRHLVNLTRLIEQLTIPVVVIGVGAQASLDYDLGAMRPLDEEVTRFARAVLDRSASIGVRGEFTAHYLAHLGFRDVEVIGCPSMFLYGSELDVRKKAPELTPDSAVAVNISRDADTFATMVDRTIERYPDLVYFAQEMKDAHLMYWGDLSEATGDTHGLPLHRTHRLLRDGKTRLYIDPSPWLEALRRFDFSFGTRIHGNIAALVAGVPAAVVCHDSRTLELCEYFAIPHRTTRALGDDADPAQLYAEADFTELLSGHQKRFDRMLDFLDTNGLRSTYRHGDGGAAFERQLAATALPAPMVIWDADGDLGYRFAQLWAADTALRLQHVAANTRIADLHRRTAGLERRLTAADRTLTARDQQLSEALRRLTAAEKRLVRLQARQQATLGSRVRRRLGRLRRSAVRRWSAPRSGG